MDLARRRQVLINLISRVGRGQQNIYRWVDELMEIDAQLEQQEQELLQIDWKLENKTEVKQMTNTYKGYKLLLSKVTFNGETLPQDRWILCTELGVVLLDNDGSEFETAEYESKITLTLAEEKEYQNILEIQRKVEKSFADGEWKFRRTSHTEQDIYGARTTVWRRWEHPTYGIVEETYDGQRWHVPSKYSAEKWKYMTLLGRKGAEYRQVNFKAWVDYWEKIDSQPKVDIYADAKAAAVKRLVDMGVPAELIDVGDKFIFVKGAKASFYGGKEVYHSLDVWYSHWDDVKITPEQVQAAHKFLYSEYKKNQAGKPCKPFEKWVLTVA